MQLRLDVLGHEQSEALGGILTQLEYLTARLDRLEEEAPPPAGGPHY
jgi:hypothetical protein